jgi:hypothetical protein
MVSMVWFVLIESFEVQTLSDNVNLKFRYAASYDVPYMTSLELSAM